MSFTKKLSDAAVIYDGPSLIDGSAIIVIATYSNRNRKTGGVLQTYILVRDTDPRDANKHGLDFSICGNCPHRGTPAHMPTGDPSKTLANRRSCYVVIGQGPLLAWRAYQRGNVYGRADNHETIAALGSGRTVRLGTYGDPAAVPSYIWESLISDAASHVGYTHQAGIQSADVRPDLCMTSADTLADAQQAWTRGERTFRVVRSYNDMTTNEIACPSYRGIQCADCRLCGGTSVPSPKSIAIVVHGNGARHFV